MKVDKVEHRIENRKRLIMESLDDCDNPYLLTQIEQLLRRKKSLKPLSHLTTQFPILLEPQIPRDLTLQKKLKSPKDNLLEKYESKAIPLFFYISLFMLVLSAAIVNAMSSVGEMWTLSTFQIRVAEVFFIGWLLYLADFLIIIILAIKTGSQISSGEFVARCIALIFPPVRLASRHLIQPELIWLPFYHWSKANEGLLKHIKQKFSIPMITIALLIIPVLIVEWKFYEEVSELLQTDLSFVLDMVQGFIWMAFAFEFILMISISNEKVHYAQQNWIDVLIILLPFIAFVRTMRIIKIARLSQLARGYKLRALLMKARQGLFFASFFYRLLSIKPDFQINNLKRKLDRNQKEREAIEEDLIELYTLLKDQRKNTTD